MKCFLVGILLKLKFHAVTTGLAVILGHDDANFAVP